MESLDWIRIQNLRVNCIIGVFAEEQTTPQQVVVSIGLGLRPQTGPRGRRFHETVDYLAISGQVSFLLTAGRFRMVESAAEALAAYLLAPPTPAEHRAAIRRVAIQIHKPGALQSPAVAQIEIERDADWRVTTVEQKSFGTVDVIYEQPEVGIYRLNISAGLEIPPHIPKRMREHELVLTHGLVAQGKLVYPGTAFRWPKDAPHTYSNPTTSAQTVLCVDSPRFLPDDRLAVAESPTEVVVEHYWAPRAADGWSLPPEG